MLGWIFAFSALTAVGTAALYEGLAVRTYTLKTPKWRRGRMLRFVVAADLHSTLLGKGQRDLLEAIEKLAPNHILLPGDIVDEHRDPAVAHTFLRGAASIAPTWYAPGNHEYRSHCVPAIVRMVERCGVTALLDNSARLPTPAGPLLIAGCEDREKAKHGYPDYNWETQLRRRFHALAGERAYTVLLSHHPDRSSLYGELGVDLAVSGHAHGGQARVPFLLNGLFAPDEGLLPKYAGGCYRQQHTAHVVSRGLAVYEEIPRIFNPPELVVVQVVGAGA